MKTYRVAIVGCRARGPKSGKAYHAHPRTEVVAVCDLVPELREALGAELGDARRYEDMDRMIEETRPDIVVVATGTEYHFPLAMRAIEHGVHVDVEKPICATLEQADELLAYAEANGRRIAVHHQQRVGPSYQAAARALRSGEIGRLRYLTASDKGYYGGYGMMNIGTHLINAMLEVAGSCTAVTATALTGGKAITPRDVLKSPSGMGVIAGEHMTATLEFEENVTASLLLHRFPVIDKRAFGIELYGTEGRIFWTGSQAFILRDPHFVPGPGESPWERLEPILPETYTPTAGVLDEEFCYVDDFVNALDERRAPRSSGQAGLHVMEVMMAAFESAAYGHKVSVPQQRRDHPLVRWRDEAGLGPVDDAPRSYEAWLAAEDARLGVPHTPPRRPRPAKSA